MKLNEQKSNYIIFSRSNLELATRLSLKYVGTPLHYLIDIYILYIRSLLEYCSVVWHSTLTQSQSSQLEAVQKLSLKIILGDLYTDYKSALDLTGLVSLQE